MHMRERPPTAFLASCKAAAVVWGFTRAHAWAHRSLDCAEGSPDHWLDLRCISKGSAPQNLLLSPLLPRSWLFRLSLGLRAVQSAVRESTASSKPLP